MNMPMTTRQKNRRRRREGFTLPEVLIASGVFVVIAVGFTTAFMTSVRQHRLAANFTSASLLAKNQLQRARSIDYVSVGLLNESNVKIDNMGNRSLDGAFTRTITVDTNSIPSCSLVTIQVWYPTWRGSHAAAPVTIQTILTEGL